MSNNRYGITEKKKAELDALTAQVANAQAELDYLQLTLNSVSARNTEYQQFYTDAKTAEATKLANLNLVGQVVDQVTNVKQITSLAGNQAQTAKNQIQKVADDMAGIVDQLIFASEIISSLATLIGQKKALNPLISDDLVTLVTTAGTNANAAVTATLTALQACFTSTLSGKSSKASLNLGYYQAKQLLYSLTGGGKSSSRYPQSIQGILEKAYTDAVETTSAAMEAKNRTEVQLNQAQADVDRATSRLNSLKAGLAAAQAAAMAA